MWEVYRKNETCIIKDGTYRIKFYGFNEFADVDFSVFLLTKDRKLPSDDYLIFYNSENRLKVNEKGSLVSPLVVTSAMDWASNDDMRCQSRPVDPEMSVIGTCDDFYDLEEELDDYIDFNLLQANKEIVECIVVASIYDYERYGGKVKFDNPYITLTSIGSSDVKTTHYLPDLSGNIGCAEIARFYKLKDHWFFEGLNKIHRKGLEELLDLYT